MKLAIVTDGFCTLCDEHGVLVDCLCSDCYEDGDGPLPRWMAALLFEEAAWIPTPDPPTLQGALEVALARYTGASA